LNLQPRDFRVPPGFVERARHREGVASLALNGLARQLLFVGSADDDDAERIGDAAVAQLSDPARRVCEQVVVAWIAADGRLNAAAFTVSADGHRGPLLATSWTPPDEWPKPMVDVSVAPDDALRAAVARVRATVRDRRRTDDFDAALQRATDVVDLQLELHGGEGQSLATHPPAGGTDEQWGRWLEHYERSVWSEWTRVGGAGDESAPDAPAAVETTGEGPLRGKRVFLSYARPEATTIAWPVRDALRALGAEVWFDREQQVDPTRLSVGLAEEIAACDAYVMCASDEFVERAGYATQEAAWAVSSRGHSARLAHFVVAAAPGAVVPTMVAEWPRVYVRDTASDDFRRELADALATPVSFSPGGVAFDSVVPPEPTTLPEHADVEAMRRRVSHLRRFDEIDNDTFIAVAGGNETGKRGAVVRRLLIDVGAGLGWAGTLDDMDDWPEDAFLRDARFRLATMRAVGSTRWPLNDDLRDAPDVSRDVEHIATRPIPFSHWRPCPGWADNERRLALRFHAGILRILDQLLHRGLFGGLLDVPQPVIDTWADKVRSRRQECADSLVRMRLEGRLQWSHDPPTWDHLFREWFRILAHSSGGWSVQLPSDVLMLIAANIDDVAAVGAQTAWCAARHGDLSIQSLELVSGQTRVEPMDVHAIGADDARTREQERGTHGLSLGLGPGAEVRISWPGGTATHAASGALAQVNAPRSR
jgi:TIR domain